MPDELHLLDLPPQASSVSRARAAVREVTLPPGLDAVIDDLVLATSEVVTNALVHAATAIQLRVRVSDTGLRVEVADGSPHLPVRRDHSRGAGTGRGLHLVGEVTDDWGACPEPTGKFVWFEKRFRGDGDGDGERAPDDAGSPTQRASVVLLNFPVLMHAAWQEHAAALLRDFMLVQFDDDEMATFQRHAQASDAINLLYQQAPAPYLGTDPDVIMSSATEPLVSEPEMTLSVPMSSIGHFTVLDETLKDATRMADEGRLLVPPPQPEVRDLCTWICDQVLEQVLSSAQPVPWSTEEGDLQQVTPISAEPPWAAAIGASSLPMLATDELSIMVAVSPAAARLLGYDDPSDLVGRRIIAIVPSRYHQAHIAGTTLHVVNGRRPLLGTPVTVPVLMRDGSEALATLVVNDHLDPSGSRYFVAEFLDDEPTA